MSFHRPHLFDWNEALFRREGGETFAALAIEYGVTERAVRKACKRLGHIPRKKWSGTPAPTERRFREKVATSDGCWRWLGSICPEGYGKFWNSGHRYAHRVAYELFVGPIPQGLVIDHLCCNRACVNPAHLEPVTQRENVRRAIAAKKLASLTDGSNPPLSRSLPAALPARAEERPLASTTSTAPDGSTVRPSAIGGVRR